MVRLKRTWMVVTIDLMVRLKRTWIVVTIDLKKCKALDRLQWRNIIHAANPNIVGTRLQ